MGRQAGARDVRRGSNKTRSEKEGVVSHKQKTNAALSLVKQNTHKALLPIANGVSVFVRERKEAAQSVRIFIGATNSGKTYNGLQQLFDDFASRPDEIAVYAAPLRLLAYEVYKKMADRFGESNVGFITGEEAINPEAKLLATTVEMAPEGGQSILIDETHWLTDADRGHAWSRILVGGKYQNIYIATAAEAVPLIKKLVDDAWNIEEQEFIRKTPISFVGKIALRDVPKKSAVVCFSRKSVYAAAKEVEKGGLRVGVLYGALPLAARKAQLDAYENGELDVVVTTDVIGHGINLPIDNVVFAQTEKFDGKERRPLHVWEAAQIAGRAGRYGLGEKGSVYAASGLQWLNSDTNLIKDGVAAAAGKSGTGLEIETAPLMPRFGDFGLNPDGGTEEAVKLTYVIEIWKRRVGKLLADRSLAASTMETCIDNIESALGYINAPKKLWDDSHKLLTAKQLSGSANLNVLELWQLATGAFEARNGILEPAVAWLTLTPSKRYNSDIMTTAFADEVERHIYNEESLLLSLEEASVKMSEFKMLRVMFGELGTLTNSRISRAENVLNERIIDMLGSSLRDATEGKCTQCGKSCSPWHDVCIRCKESSARASSRATSGNKQQYGVRQTRKRTRRPLAA